MSNNARNSRVRTRNIRIQKRTKKVFSLKGDLRVPETPSCTTSTILNRKGIDRLLAILVSRLKYGRRKLRAVWRVREMLRIK